jgi:L-malate glycosyltransferase
MISFLFVDSERVWRGGQDQLLTLLAGLARRGHEVHLICHARTLLEDRSRSAGIQVHPLRFPRFGGLTTFLRLVPRMRRIKPDILAFNTPQPILPANLASRFAPVKVRIIFRRVNFPLRRNPVTRIKYRWGIHCIVAISESIAFQLQKAGVPESRIRTVYEGINLSLYPPRRAPLRHPPGEPTVIGTVAHLSREKGLFYLMEAAGCIPDVQSRLHFVIVGEGRCRQELEQQARDRGLSRCVEFVGFQSAPAEFLKNFDIFVLPSLSEGLSSSILTAMATALPVIATDVGGIPELVRHGDNGLLVPPADPTALAAAIMQLAGDPERAFQMGQRGRERMEERFTLERKIIETERLCVSLLESARPTSRSTHV